MAWSEIKAEVANSQQLERDLREERSRYQSLLSEHLHLEERYGDLKDEMRLSVVSNMHDVFSLPHTHRHTHSLTHTLSHTLSLSLPHTHTHTEAVLLSLAVHE